MPQPEAARNNGNWKALFICPNSKITRELGPLLHHFLPAFTSHELNSFPTRHQISDLLAAQAPSVCFVEMSDPPDRALELIPELLRIDPKLPIVGVLSSNDPELVLRCLRQGASDFLMQPFTIE